MEGVTSLGRLHMSRLYKGQRIEVILNKNNLISSVFFIDFRLRRFLGNWGVFFDCLRMRTRSISPRVPMNARDLGSILRVCACAGPGEQFGSLRMCSWSMGHVAK